MQHLDETEQSYAQHLKFAWSFAGTLLHAALVVFLHGLYPSSASHWKGRRLIIEAYLKLPYANDIIRHPGDSA